MSAISEKLKEVIISSLDEPKKNIEDKVDRIIEITRKGDNAGESIKNTLQQIKDAEIKINLVEGTTKTVKSVVTSLKAARKVAEATEKSSTIGSALNPTAAAIAVVQKFIIEKVKIEIKESEDALNVSPTLIDNFKSFVTEQKDKLKKAQRERERKKLIREQRKRKLNS